MVKSRVNDRIPCAGSSRREEVERRSKMGSEGGDGLKHRLEGEIG